VSVVQVLFIDLRCYGIIDLALVSQ